MLKLIPSIVVSLHEIGQCLLDMIQHDETLKYFERALQIKQRAITNAETDSSLATTLHGIGRCLVDMNQHDEALNYLASLATILHGIGRCLLHMNQYDEALKYFERVL